MNIIILHSLNGDTIKTWGQDIKNKFENNTINVYMPEFPIRENSSYEKFKEILDEYLNEGILNSDFVKLHENLIEDKDFLNYSRILKDVLRDLLF